MQPFFNTSFIRPLFTFLFVSFLSVHLQAEPAEQRDTSVTKKRLFSDLEIRIHRQLRSISREKDRGQKQILYKEIILAVRLNTQASGIKRLKFLDLIESHIKTKNKDLLPVLSKLLARAIREIPKPTSWDVFKEKIETLATYCKKNPLKPVALATVLVLGVYSLKNSGNKKPNPNPEPVPSLHKQKAEKLASVYNIQNDNDFYLGDTHFPSVHEIPCPKLLGHRFLYGDAPVRRQQSLHCGLFGAYHSLKAAHLSFQGIDWFDVTGKMNAQGFISETLKSFPVPQNQDEELAFRKKFVVSLSVVIETLIARNEMLKVKNQLHLNEISQPEIEELLNNHNANQKDKACIKLDQETLGVPFSVMKTINAINYTKIVQYFVAYKLKNLPYRTGQTEIINLIIKNRIPKNDEEKAAQKAHVVALQKQYCKKFEIPEDRLLFNIISQENGCLGEADIDKAIKENAILFGDFEKGQYINFLPLIEQHGVIVEKANIDEGKPMALLMAQAEFRTTHARTYVTRLREAETKSHWIMVHVEEKDGNFIIIIADSLGRSYYVKCPDGFSYYDYICKALNEIDPKELGPSIEN